MPNNKQGSLRRLNHLTKRLHRDGLTTEYDDIIREQLNEGIVERAPEAPGNKEFYIPHKAVVKESAESMKTRIVYDASAKASSNAPSLNECLNPGPPLQNKLWDVLVQQRALSLSNVKELERDSDQPENHDEQSFAKQQFGVQPSETKMLGLKWNKVEDTLTINFPEDDHPVTRRGILGKLAKIYDPLGLVSPLTLEGKLVYRAACESKTPWDAKLDDKLTQRWEKWERITPKNESTPRAIVDHREPVDELELHAFGDACTQGVGAAVYSIVRQESGVTQRLVAAKGRLAKQGLTIPRLELVSAHMATNLVTNVSNALQGLPKPRIFGWLDSSVALHWICGNGQYKQFVANRVAKIQLHPEIEWRYVPTHDNPADLASRGGPVTTPLWWTGPEWLQDHDRWPTNPITKLQQIQRLRRRLLRKSCVSHK